MTGADAGSVYVVEEEGGSEAEYKPPPKKFLHFMLSQNDSIEIDFKEFMLDIDDKSIVGQAVLSKHADQHPGPVAAGREPEDASPRCATTAASTTRPATARGRC